MANVLCCIKHCWGVYEQNNIVNSICVGDWTAELAIIASNVKVLPSQITRKEWLSNYWKRKKPIDIWGSLEISLVDADCKATMVQPEAGESAIFTSQLWSKHEYHCIVEFQRGHNGRPLSFFLRFLRKHHNYPNNQLNYKQLLLSATVVAERLYFQKCLSIHRGEVYTPQADTPLGRPPQGKHPKADTPWADTPGADTSLLPEMATTADGTHPTGMHSCYIHDFYYRFSPLNNMTMFYPCDTSLFAGPL